MAEQPHFRYEPENIETDEKILLPIGTVEEVKAEGMDLTKVPTCHVPVENGAEPILGCPFAAINRDTGMSACKLTIKGVSGPQLFAVKVQKGRVQGGKMFIAEHPCFFIARHKDAIEENGGSMTIVATEGKPYHKVVAGPETGYKDKVVSTMKDADGKEVPLVVGHFPRPKENPDVAFEILKALERAEQVKEKAERAADRTS